MKTRKSRRVQPPAHKTSRAYRQVWRVVDGAVRDAVIHHEDYFTERGLTAQARASIVKRVTGAIIGYAEQSARR